MNNPLALSDPSGEDPCKEPGVSAICQNGSYFANAYFLNFAANWDPFEGVFAFVPGENGDAAFSVLVHLPFDLYLFGGAGGCGVALGGANLSFVTCPFPNGPVIISTAYRLERTSDCFNGLQRQSVYSLQNANGTPVEGNANITEYQTNPSVTSNGLGTSSNRGKGSTFFDTIGPSFNTPIGSVTESSRIFAVNVNGEFLGAVPVLVLCPFSLRQTTWSKASSGGGDRDPHHKYLSMAP